MSDAAPEAPDPRPRDHDLPHPLLPEQPADGERPIPLRAAPERTAEPSDWSGSDDERLDGRQPHAPHAPPADAGRDLREEAPDWAEDEAAYSTELQQGSVHPLLHEHADDQVTSADVDQWDDAPRGTPDAAP